MKILSGKLKGRKIFSQKKGLRPTTAMVKASLFNILGVDIIKKTFTDVFAGTGAVGFEAYSRGASEVYFVEQNPEAVNLLKKNIDQLGVNAKVFKRNAFDFLKSRSLTTDFLFFSPPYDTIHWHQLMRAVEESPVIGKHTLVIIQHPKMVNLESFVLKKVDERRYGLNKLSFYRKEED
jgi:16S rRNA (guanine966-N2)-methyltransferase